MNIQMSNGPSRLSQINVPTLVPGGENLVALFQVSTCKVSRTEMSVNWVVSGHHQFLSGVFELSSRLVLLSRSLITGFVSFGSRSTSALVSSSVFLINDLVVDGKFVV